MIEKTLQETLPESIHPQVTTLQEDIYEAQATENKLKGIILFFSIVSLLITLLGVYSTITLDTERRQKEVAIRKVNGAGLKQIILLFARLYIRLLTVSAVIAFPLIYIVIQMWKKAYIVFFNDGIIYWAGIFIGITFITALTVLFRIPVSYTHLDVYKRQPGYRTERILRAELLHENKNYLRSETEEKRNERFAGQDRICLLYTSLSSVKFVNDS